MGAVRHLACVSAALPPHLTGGENGEAPEKQWHPPPHQQVLVFLAPHRLLCVGAEGTNDAAGDKELHGIH